MRKILLVTIFLMAALGALLSMTRSAQQAEDPGVLLRAAIEKEEVDGDLQAAIDLYKQIVAKYSDQEAIAAKAQLRIGMCYEKLGNTEALKAYEAVLSRFPKETEAVAEARSRLAALRKEEPAGLTMSRILPPEVYLECQTLSPDGTKVLGINYDKGQNVAFYDLASGKLEMVTNFNWKEESFWTYNPAWSADGREVIFKVGSWKDQSIAKELWISNLEGKSRKLFENPHGSIAPCDWLPDGSAVVAVYANENKTASLGLISVKEGILREICPLLRTSNRGGDPADAVPAGAVDASPDGRFIAFSDGPSNANRDIYIISMDGGSKTAITNHPADDIEPRWSPDGRQIVFLSDRHGSKALWGVAVQDGRPDGQPFMILEGMRDSDLCNWTKRGLLSNTTIVIHDIYTLEIDPQSHDPLGRPEIVDFTPSGSNYSPLWSPDGKYLAFFSPWRMPSPLYSHETGDNFVIILSSEGGNAQRFNIPARSYRPYRRRWLSDSSGLGFYGFGEDQTPYFHRLDLATGNWKTHTIPSADNSTDASAGNAGSEDRFCFYLFQPSSGGLDIAAPGVYALDPETGRKRYILDDQEIKTLTWGHEGVSDDNKRLVVGMLGDIALIDIDTGQIEKLQFEKELLRFPAWSPDGKYLIAGGRSGGGESIDELFIVSLADGQVKSLDISRYLPPKTQIWQMPDWSPDGRKIAFGTRSWKFETNLIQNVIPKK